MSTNSWLPEGFERLARIPARSRAESGSPVGLLLEWAGDIRDIRAIPAIRALVHRWMPVLRAKRAIETLVEHRKAFVHVPKVPSLAALQRDLAEAGIRASVLPNASIDVRAIRDRLGLTQEQFAIRYGLEIEAVRNWETGRRTPDTAAQSYLRTIAAMPDAVEAALWSGLR